MIKSMLCVIAAAVIALFVTFHIHLDESKKKTSDIEARIERLEDRTGGLCAAVYGESTGFDKAMIKGGK